MACFTFPFSSGFHFVGGEIDKGLLRSLLALLPAIMHAFVFMSQEIRYKHYLVIL